MVKRKLNYKNLLLFLLFFFFICLFLFSVIKILIYLNDNHKNKKIKDSILEQHVEYVPSTEDTPSSYKVDFEALKKDNPDTIAYLKVFGTDIDYVVVRGEDNSYYLKHNFYHEWNVSGWVFSDFQNRFDGTDQNIVIFGHNTQDGSMFGSLKNVLSDEWRSKEDNQKILLVTELGTFYYQVFSTYVIEPEDYYIQTSFSSDDYSSFLNTIKSRSSYPYDVSLDTNDSILTLSSCNISGSKRIVLHAKLLTVPDFAS